MLIVLDRDGVINFESDEYIKSPDEWIPIPGSLSAIASLKKAGHTVVVATNQSGIGRGYYTHEILAEIHKKFRDLLKEFDCDVDAIFYCPHRPDENCECRKPKPGLFQQIHSQFNNDWSDSIAVGDALRDIQAANSVGCSSMLVRTGRGKMTIEKGKGLDGIEIVDDLEQFARKIIA
ncbi:MAG: D-glycero-beta-D-manno-heptose 1,7-bisphosphate 7-phosphatase [Gammaproteobacteria bacterium]|nr:D-glycero-beta-D-manno-heptose 1,7-bisphosphate 7-phosphatase [Gammaproteobacteria bacterium]